MKLCRFSKKSNNSSQRTGRNLKIQEKLLPNSILYITALTTPLRIIQVPMESFRLKLSNESTTSNFCAMKSREEFKPSTISSHQLSKNRQHPGKL